MKRIFTTLIVTFLSTQIQAQIENTSWTGTFYFPDPIECVMEIKNDTMQIREKNGFLVFESAEMENGPNYFVLKTIQGNLKCEDKLGTYVYSIENDKLTLKVYQDECTQRVMAFPDEPLVKLEN